MRKVAMLLVAGCTIGMLTGCGVPQEEVDAMIAEVEADCAAQVDVLNGTIADNESIIQSEKAKNRQSRIELDDATERISDLQQKNAEISKELAGFKSQAAKLDSDLKTAKNQAAAAQDQAKVAQDKYSTLDVEYQELNRRFEMFKKNMSALGTPATATTTTAVAPAKSAGTASPVSATPETDAQKASSLLDAMGTL
jgi:chromosome segregation ATPase